MCKVQYRETRNNSSSYCLEMPGARILEWRISQSEFELIAQDLADHSTSQKGHFISFFMMSEVLSYSSHTKAKAKLSSSKLDFL